MALTLRQALALADQGSGLSFLTDQMTLMRCLSFHHSFLNQKGCVSQTYSAVCFSVSIRGCLCRAFIIEKIANHGDRPCSLATNLLWLPLRPYSLMSMNGAPLLPASRIRTTVIVPSRLSLCSASWRACFFCLGTDSLWVQHGSRSRQSWN